MEDSRRRKHGGKTEIMRRRLESEVRGRREREKIRRKRKRKDQERWKGRKGGEGRYWN